MGDFTQDTRDLTKLYAEASKLLPNGRVRLIHIDAQDIDPGDGAIGAGHLYFHYHAVPHTAAEIAAAAGDTTKLGPKQLKFGGQAYDFWPCDISGLTLSTEQAASPTLTVVDVKGAITRLCMAHSNLMGAKVEIIDTFANFLDGAANADSTQYQKQTFYIDSIPSRTPGTNVAFSMTSPADLEGMQIPRRQIGVICSWAMDGLYGSGDGCSWDRTKAGIKYYDENGVQVASVTNDKCGGCISDCKLRFGQGYTDPNAAPLDFGAFPGARLVNG